MLLPTCQTVLGVCKPPSRTSQKWRGVISDFNLSKYGDWFWILSLKADEVTSRNTSYNETPGVDDNKEEANIWNQSTIHSTPVNHGSSVVCSTSANDGGEEEEEEELFSHADQSQPRCVSKSFKKNHVIEDCSTISEEVGKYVSDHCVYGTNFVVYLQAFCTFWISRRHDRHAEWLTRRRITNRADRYSKQTQQQADELSRTRRLIEFAGLWIKLSIPYCL